ncbi:MAG: ABC transporter substrate-binding protein [Nanoarchaeota archaeon]|nr:ABC transporter substrate-binding protein [Nanoarchaeota archaeon]
MKSAIKICVGLLLMSLIIVAGCKESVVNEKQTIKIGAVVPLTGGAAFLGEGVRNAMLLAKEQLKDSKYNYEIIFEDDALDAKLSATAAQKLINIDNVDALVSISSGTGNVVAKIAQESQIIHFGIASDPAVATGAYNFIHWTPPEKENPVLIKELQKRGISKIAVIGMNHAWVAAEMKDLKERLPGTDIELVSEQYFNSGERDFRTIILKAREESPQIYVILAFSPEVELIAQQVKDLGITTPLTSVESFELTEKPELFEGYWYVQAADPTAEFLEGYNARYGEDPKLGGPNAYDIFNLIVNAFEKAGKSSAEKPSEDAVVKELSAIKSFRGALGTLEVGKEGIVQSEAVVRMIKNGKPVTVRS